MRQVDISTDFVKLFAYTPLQYMLRAMQAGTAPAKFFADQADKAFVGLILEGHTLFAGGDVSDEALRFLDEELLNGERRRELGAVKAFYPDDAWKTRLLESIHGADMHVYGRRVYKREPGEGSSVPAAPHIQRITPRMMGEASIGNREMIREEVESTFGSLESFLAGGFGYALVLHNRVCGFCTSEYQSAKECAIGIAVEAEFQRRGYASQMASAFVAECDERRLTAYWECWGNNIPSMKTAERSGFIKLADYPTVLMEFARP
jgi:RimJ/RimL family protein N-acetyltransferase